jgi:predicted component of type VI protein secretion system
MLQLRFVGQDKPPVWLVENHYLLGSDASCNLLLTGAGIQPRHAELSVVGEQLSVTPIVRGAVLAVDGLLISHATPLTHNSRLSLGDVHLLVVDPKIQKTLAEPAVMQQVEWCLVSTTTALANRRFPIAGSVIVGRSAECDISLGVAHLSRKHARLWVEDGQLWVEDMSSSNGTYVNHQRVGRTQLKKGDLLGLDTLVFSVLGGPEGGESDGDKTSLRPAASAASTPRSTIAEAPPAPVARARPAEVKIRPPQNSADVREDSTGGAGWQLWLGVLLVGFLTAFAVFYLLN